MELEMILVAHDGAGDLVGDADFRAAGFVAQTDGQLGQAACSSTSRVLSISPLRRYLHQISSVREGGDGEVIAGRCPQRDVAQIHQPFQRAVHVTQAGLDAALVQDLTHRGEVVDALHGG